MGKIWEKYGKSMGNIKELLKEDVEERAYTIFCSNGFFRMWDYLDDEVYECVITAYEADMIERKVFEKYASWK